MKNDQFTEAAHKLVEFLKSQAKEKNITEVEIARRTGLKQQNVNRLFLGKYLPSLDNFLKISDAIDFQIKIEPKPKQ